MSAVPDPATDPAPVTGNAMDTIVARPRSRLWLRLLAGVVAGSGLLWLLWQQVPRGLQVNRAELQLARVERAQFRDELVLRATAEAVDAVILDSVESGRVEEVFARDGELVAQGQALFRIANPQRHLELLARQAEQAQQIYNLSNLRLAQESDTSARQRRLDELAFALQQAEKRLARTEQLAARGFVSVTVLEEARDQLAKEQRALGLEQARAQEEGAVRSRALAQLERAIGTLDGGLALVKDTVEALVVRAPVAGRLTDFRLLVGESITNGKNVGRIDDPAHVKLSVRIDEFYLNRVAAGRAGVVRHDGRDYPVAVARVYPQVKDGRFLAELHFSQGEPAGLQPGQGLEVLLTLGEPGQALLLPAGPFLGDSGGAWVFVVTPDGKGAQRRAIRIGRRSSKQVEIHAGLAEGEQVIVSGYASFGPSTVLSISQ